jgi:alkyl hydroperoxide reductase subunit D
VIEAVTAEFGPRLDPAAFAAAKAAAAIMAMNNVYYRFLHLVEDEEYAKLRAGLRMNVIANPGTARENFELWSLAVSAVNGCGKCMTAHEKVLREAGLTREQIQAAVRIAAVVHAVAVTLETMQRPQCNHSTTAAWRALPRRGALLVHLTFPGGQDDCRAVASRRQLGRGSPS